jgi:glycosyltransferase involved in cell wall biosynthesis
MRLSVIVPAFNNEAALHRSLATLSNQTVRPHEVIVVDDGSKPRLHNPTGRYGSNWARFVRIKRESTHRGSSAAKNLGARIATGDWLVFADSDILHLPDAIESLAKATEEWPENTLLNVMRVGLPQDYPQAYYSDLDVLMRNCRTAGLLIDEDRDISATCWEQNCGMINRAYFWSLGGYDETAFPSWGFNNQDLDARVILDGGHVTSNIARTDGKRLYCFHVWHENNCDKERAKSEWCAKWGEEFGDPFMHRLYALRDAGDVSQYADRIRGAA